jgi:hypothetical protein
MRGALRRLREGRFEGGHDPATFAGRQAPSPLDDPLCLIRHVSPERYPTDRAIATFRGCRRSYASVSIATTLLAEPSNFSPVISPLTGGCRADVKSRDAA